MNNTCVKCGGLVTSTGGCLCYMNANIKSVARSKKIDIIKNIPDAELLREFRRRFGESVLCDLELTKVLEGIGTVELKKYLKEMNFRLVKIKSGV